MNTLKIAQSLERYPDVPRDIILKVYRMADNLNMTRDEIHQFLSFMQKIELEDKTVKHPNPISPLK